MKVAPQRWGSMVAAKRIPQQAPCWVALAGAEAAATEAVLLTSVRPWGRRVLAWWLAKARPKHPGAAEGSTHKSLHLRTKRAEVAVSLLAPAPAALQMGVPSGRTVDGAAPASPCQSATDHLGSPALAGVGALDGTAAVAVVAAAGAGCGKSACEKRVLLAAIAGRPPLAGAFSRPPSASAPAASTGNC